MKAEIKNGIMAQHLVKLEYLYFNLRSRQPHHLQSLHVSRALFCQAYS